jgi:membrane associated rhomboid family serine protease
MRLTLERTVGASAAALIASSATLVCCVLPAVMVSLGAGAVLVGMVSMFPQLVWLSEHKGAVFGVAGVMLVLSGSMLHRSSRLPCPTDPAAASMFWTAAAAYVAGSGFVLIGPVIAGS